MWVIKQQGLYTWTNGRLSPAISPLQVELVPKEASWVHWTVHDLGLDLLEQVDDNYTA